MEPVLTQEELEAIYAAMKGDDIPAASVDDVALSAGQEFIQRSENKWNEAIKFISPSLESILTGALGQRVSVQPQPAEAWLDEETADSEGLPSFFSSVGTVTTVTRFSDIFALISIDIELARRVIERRTGAKPSSEYGAKEKGITSLELKLLKDVLLDLAAASGKAVPEAADVELSSMAPEDMWAKRKKGELWVLSGVKVREVEGRTLNIFAPSRLFMPQPVDVKKVISSHLKSAGIVLAAELGKFRMSVRNLWRMRPGTVIPMGTTVGDPLRLTIGGVPKLLGEPMAQRGNVAVKIQKRIEKGAVR
jgi:flagellar motor switch protein FliM